MTSSSNSSKSIVRNLVLAFICLGVWYTFVSPNAMYNKGSLLSFGWNQLLINIASSVLQIVGYGLLLIGIAGIVRSFKK